MNQSSDQPPLSIGGRRILLQDGLKAMRREIQAARKALTTAEKTLVFLEAQWNDDLLMKKAREVNAERTHRTGSRRLRD